MARLLSVCARMQDQVGHLPLGLFDEAMANSEPALNNPAPRPAV